jgi:hypothetical protein
LSTPTFARSPTSTLILSLSVSARCPPPRSHGWSRADVGKEVDLPSGGRAVLTLAMTDSGLNEVTRLLDDATGGHHYSIKGIAKLREPDGSHGVWGARASVMVYKITYAAKRCGLAILAFDINQKSKCAALRCITLRCIALP